MPEILVPQSVERPVVQHHKEVRYRALYRARCLPDAEWQRQYLEHLRYKWGNYQGWPRIMQRLGNWGRSVGFTSLFPPRS